MERCYEAYVWIRQGMSKKNYRYLKKNKSLVDHKGGYLHVCIQLRDSPCGELGCVSSKSYS